MATPTGDRTIFVLVDLPRDGPFKTWQQFKDFAREALNKSGHHPGRTEWDHYADGSDTGFTICKTREDAKLIYDHVIKLTHQGSCVNVHLYDTAWSKYYPLECNCPTKEHQLRINYYQHHIRFLAHYVVPTSPIVYAPQATWPSQAVAVVPDQVAALSTGMQSLTMNHSYYPAVAPASIPYYSMQPPAAPSYGHSAQYQPGYVTNSQGYPVNAANGLVRAEHNVVILKNLDPDVTEPELQAVLGKTVSPVSLNIMRSPDPKKRSISATAVFRSHKEAKRVAEHFRQRQIHVRKRPIRADIAKDSSPRSALQPPVVNGST